MRLIDADDISYVQAIDATDDLDYVRRYNIDRMPTIDTTPIRQEQAIDFLQKSGWMVEHDKALTENAVPVVRCKDCKIKDDIRCPWWHGVPSDEFYCAWGEREDDETD